MILILIVILSSTFMIFTSYIIYYSYSYNLAIKYITATTGIQPEDDAVNWVEQVMVSNSNKNMRKTIRKGEDMKKVEKRIKMMDEMLEALKPWFGDTLEISCSSIIVRTAGCAIMILEDTDNWCNNYSMWCKYYDFRLDDLFNKMARDVRHEDILNNIKKVWSVDTVIEELKSELPDDVTVVYGGLYTIDGRYTIVSKCGEINLAQWHKRTLKHDVFKFNGNRGVILTKDNAEEFKKIVIDYFKPDVKEMSIEDIQKELGYKVKVVESDVK